jgi:hypothetical protein
VTGVVRHPCGPRLYVVGVRVHHGAAGCAIALVGAALRSRLVAAAGLAMVVEDLPDFPWRDRDNHAPRSSRSAPALRPTVARIRVRPGSVTVTDREEPR